MILAHNHDAAGAIVRAAIPSRPTQSRADRVACLACRTPWVAISPASAPVHSLECPKCTARRSTPALDAWCSACGADDFVIAQGDAASGSGECPRCHAHSLFVEQADAA